MSFVNLHFLLEEIIYQLRNSFNIELSFGDAVPLGDFFEIVEAKKNSNDSKTVPVSEVEVVEAPKGDNSSRITEVGNNSTDSSVEMPPLDGMKEKESDDVETNPNDTSPEEETNPAKEAED